MTPPFMLPNPNTKDLIFSMIFLSFLFVVARIRPQNAREKIDMCQVCTSVSDEDKQILLGKDKAFTFDYVFDTPTDQDTIYNTCVRQLIDG